MTFLHLHETLNRAIEAAWSFPRWVGA